VYEARSEEEMQLELDGRMQGRRRRPRVADALSGLSLDEHRRASDGRFGWSSGQGRAANLSGTSPC
jgi:hypothetical protein